MEVKAQIIKKSGSLYKIQFVKQHACKGCGMCANASDENRKILEIESSEEFEVNEIVNVDLEDSNVILASFIVYMLPILLFFAGYLIGYFIEVQFFSDYKWIKIVSAIFGFLLSFIYIYQYSKKNRKKYMPKLNKIVM